MPFGYGRIEANGRCYRRAAASGTAFPDRGTAFPDPNHTVWMLCRLENVAPRCASAQIGLRLTSDV
jgi:hypothetical protein